MRAILSIIYIILDVVVSMIILMQEGKSNGLGGAIGGISVNNYWSKNRGRSMEGVLEHFAGYGVITFMFAAIALNIVFKAMG